PRRPARLAPAPTGLHLAGMTNSRLASALIVAAVAVPAAAQRIAYPPTRTVDTVTNYHGTKVPDPYRWLEEIDSPGVAAWVKAENAVTMPYLASLPGRDAFNARMTALYNFPRTSTPFFEGGRWFFNKNTGLQKQGVWYSRETLTGADRLVLDANKLSPDGSISLSDFTPSPDGKHYVYGQSE